jgi:hypothetical protein
MDIVGTARKIERRLARSVDAAVGELVRRPAPAAIEMVHTAVELSEQRVQDVGRGRRVFPFNRVVLHVLTPAQDPEARTRVEAIAEGPPSLTDRLRERLLALGCDAAGVSAELVFADAAAADWTSPGFHVEFLKVAPKPPLPRPVNLPPPLVRLTPVAGTTARRGYAFTAQRIDIGRGAEVLDGRQRVTRTNHVAFAEESDHLSSTVSRRHAHVVYVPLSQEYRICDDRSAHGTAVLRDGRTIPVPPGTRGVRLQPGDEILLGKARLRVAIDTPPRAAPRRSR